MTISQDFPLKVSKKMDDLITCIIFFIDLHKFIQLITGCYYLTSHGMTVDVTDRPDDPPIQIFTCSRKLILSKHIQCDMLKTELSVLLNSSSFTMI